jgi:aspartate/tyrosine/aromatic aminotransferase
MFQHVSPAPPDPILGLSEAFRADPHPDKINLAVGIYKDEHGQTPVLGSVKEAERRIVAAETTKSYLPIDGDPDYGRLVQRMILGPEDPRIDDGRTHSANTPGGTGALRVAGDYLKAIHPGRTLWLSDPTWSNHPGIFGAAGVAQATYRYFDAEHNTLDLAGMLEDIGRMKPHDIVLLHGCCHNPTGVDPDAEQWRQIAEAVAAARVLPLVDFAYQGFGEGLEKDAAGLRIIAEHCPDLLVCSSFSKNFGLYRDRVGALTVVAQTAELARSVTSHLKVAIRRNYSNPPAHGSEIVTTILADDDLTAQWQNELAGMRKRIHAMREAFAAGLDQRGVKLTPEGNGFIARQEGMFSLTGLTREHVTALRERHSIYAVGSGRVNVAGMTADNVPRLCDAIADVV